MRYGVLADIHGNLHALRAVLAAVERQRVDRYLVAGDLVGYGPNPNECVELVAELDAVCVAGNHDLIVLGRLSDERCIPLARESLAWTRTVLRDDARAFLAALPLRAAAPGGVELAHGSLDDPQEYTIDRAQASAQLAAVAAAGQRALILGHTHVPWAFATGAGAARARGGVRLPATEPMLLNPGAVGQSRELRVRARYLVLDLDDGSASFGAVRYDVGGTRAELERVGLPPGACHLRPSLARAAGRAVRRRMRERGWRS
jgi:predicted phosphodiesterase